MTLDVLQEALESNPRLELRVKQECRHIVARLYDARDRRQRPLSTGTGGTILEAAAGLELPREWAA